MQNPDAPTGSGEYQQIETTVRFFTKALTRLGCTVTSSYNGKPKGFAIYFQGPYQVARELAEIEEFHVSICSEGRGGGWLVVLALEYMMDDPPGPQDRWMHRNMLRRAAKAMALKFAYLKGGRHPAVDPQTPTT